MALTSLLIDDSPILVCPMVFGVLMLRMVMRKSCFVVVVVVVAVETSRSSSSPVTSFRRYPIRERWM